MFTFSCMYIYMYTHLLLVRPSTLPNLYTISAIEEEELENEFLSMKKLVNIYSR